MKYVITVFGLGFVGLTTALGFAEKGNVVYGVDIDENRISKIKDKKIPFEEPILEDKLKEHLNKNFIVENIHSECVKKSDFVFICVGTPLGDDGSAYLGYVFDVLDKIIVDYNDNKKRVVVIKSTVPPATTKVKVIPYISSKDGMGESKFMVANNPEFLREGKCWEDFFSSDRIVCGVEEDEAADMLKDLYSDFDAPFCKVSFNTAEFIKYLSNSMLASMISFSNEMSIVADHIGDINIKDSFKIIHMDKRWGNSEMKSYMYPGCGYGGYCLPKDTKALHSKAIQSGYRAEILENVISVNEKMPLYASKKIMDAVQKFDTIAILGLSFKPDSDDVRESSAYKIIRNLGETGYKKILAYDPVAVEQFKLYYDFDFVEYKDSIEEACKNADVIVLVTTWKEFSNLKVKYPSKKIIDLRYYL